MATANFQLIEALREAANRLRNGAHYAWGNHGACNCGNLLQVITTFSEADILRHAQTAHGEWTELSVDYCHITNAPLDMMISRLGELGLTPSDIHNLEYLEDRNVLNHLPGGFRWLKRNVREHVILYFETFASMLEEDINHSINIELLFSENQQVPSPVY